MKIMIRCLFLLFFTTPTSTIGFGETFFIDFWTPTYWLVLLGVGIVCFAVHMMKSINEAYEQYRY